MLRPTTRSPVLVHHPDDAALVRPAADPARARAHHARHRPTPARSSWSPPTRSRRGSRCSTRPTSTRSRSATAASPRSCSRPPTCGCSSPRPRATPTRCRGTSSSRPPTAAPPSRSCSTAPRRGAVAEVSSHLARMLTARGLQRLAAVHRRRRRRSTTTGCCPPTAVAEIRGWLRELGADAEARNGVVRQTLDGAIRSIAPSHLRRRRRLPWPRSTCAARLKRDVDASYDEAVDRHRRGLRRRHPAARRGARPLAGVRRHRRAAARAWSPRSAGCATGSPTRSRASRSRPSG